MYTCARWRPRKRYAGGRGLRAKGKVRRVLNSTAITIGTEARTYGAAGPSSSSSVLLRRRCCWLCNSSLALMEKSVLLCFDTMRFHLRDRVSDGTRRDEERWRLHDGSQHDDKKEQAKAGECEKVAAKRIVSRRLTAKNDLCFSFIVGTRGPHYVKDADRCTHV